MKDDLYTKKLISMVENAMKFGGFSYAQLADRLAEKEGKPSSRQGVFKKVKNGSMKATDLMKILDVLGMELVVGREGESVPTRSAVGERVVRTVKGKKYDTKRCCSVADSFYLDGENQYHDHKAEELYLDPEKRQYFIVHYSDVKRARVEVLADDGVERAIATYLLR